MAQLTLTTEATQALVDNIASFEELDPTDEGEFTEGTQRLLAIRYMLTDILRQVGEDESTPTDLEDLARDKNPFYVAIFVNAGRMP